LFEATGYIKERRFKIGLQASLVCYARAIRGPGWDAMASGANSPAQGVVASNWTGTGPHGMRLRFQRMGTDHPVFGTITSLDRQRGDARRQRLALAQSSVPKVISMFMLVLVFLTVVALAFFIPRVDNTAHRVALFVACSVLVFSLALIRSLDRPLHGGAQDPAHGDVDHRRRHTQDFEAESGRNRLPCNRRGEPVDAKS
jgi:hypothetical protein